MRWQLADDADEPQSAFFSVADLVGPEQSTGRMSQLEFLPVASRKLLNRVPPQSGMPFRWTINAYRGCSHACTYCFARPTHEYLGLGAGEDFQRKIVVKINAVERVRAELAHPRWHGEHVAMGTNTDPYQRAEAKFRLTRGIITELADAGTPFSILTKSGLVERDLDVLVEAAAKVDVSVSFSIGTIDPAVWRATEPGAPDPRRRLAAMRALANAGVRTSALIAPILPGFSDRRGALTETVHAVLDAGGAILGARPLYLRGSTREYFLQWLADHDPALHARYLNAYESRIELPPQYSEWINDVLGQAVASYPGAQSLSSRKSWTSIPRYLGGTSTRSDHELEQG